MELAALSGFSVFSVFGIFSLNKQIQKLYEEFMKMQSAKYYTPGSFIDSVNILTQNAPKHNFSRKGDEFRGMVFLEGIIDATLPVMSQLKGKPLVHSCYFTSDIYSNEMFSLESQKKLKVSKDYKNPIINIAPYMMLKDFEKSEISAKIFRNVMVNAVHAFDVISKKNQLKVLGFGEKFFVLAGMIVEFISTLTHMNFKFRGIKIGYSEIELGIKLNSIITIYGEMIYNIKTNQMQVQNPLYFLKDRNQILAKVQKKIQKRKIMLVICYIPLIINMFVMFKKILKKFQLYWKRRKEAYLDNLRNVKHLIVDDMKCSICADNMRNIILKPCKHMCMCNECYGHLKKQECPICKTPIDDYVEVFIA